MQSQSSHVSIMLLYIAQIINTETVLVKCHLTHKEGRVFRMVDGSILPHAEF